MIKYANIVANSDTHTSFSFKKLLYHFITSIDKSHSFAVYTATITQFCIIRRVLPSVSKTSFPFSALFFFCIRIGGNVLLCQVGNLPVGDRTVELHCRLKQPEASPERRFFRQRVITSVWQQRASSEKSNGDFSRCRRVLNKIIPNLIILTLHWSASCRKPRLFWKSSRKMSYDFEVN